MNTDEQAIQVDVAVKSTMLRRRHRLM